LVLSGLAIFISFLSAVGSITAVFMTRANVRWQLHVATQEAWMREFSKQITQLLASAPDAAMVARDGPAAAVDIVRQTSAAVHAINLLIAEKKPGPRYAELLSLIDQLVVAAWGSRVDLHERVSAVSKAAAEILRQERAR